MNTTTPQSANSPYPPTVNDLLEQWSPRIQKMARVARRWKSPLFDPDDVMQELLIEFWRTAPKYDPRKSPEFYAFMKKRLEWKLIKLSQQARAASSLYIADACKSQCVDSECYEALEDSAIEQLSLTMAIERLPEPQRQAATDYRAGYTFTDIAERTASSRQRAYARVINAANRLAANRLKEAA